MAIGIPDSQVMEDLNLILGDTSYAQHTRCWHDSTTNPFSSCDSPRVATAGQSQSGWIYCYQGDCATSASIHETVWNGAPPSEPYGGIASAYRQWYGGYYGVCNEPNGGCFYGTTGQDVAGVSAFNGETIWDYDPGVYDKAGYGSPCSETYYNSGQWQCSAKGGFGAFLDVE
ncbi:MAG TPA: hypothetical protein VM286_06080 [Candidatus Thermoplasmatota archaeon]|nr:hypothetical protein [Candidatus Thermoplasmatota archaeon]